MNKFYKNEQEARNEYYEYLEQHITGVQKAFIQLRPYIPEEYLLECASCVNKHDQSKYDDIEFIPYMKKFYPTCEDDLSDENKKLYDLAWLHHIHKNPHHPQHWILHEDSGKIVSLDMNYIYIIEMLCDWHSFSQNNPSSTAYNWWMKNKNHIQLSFNTKEIVISLINYLKEPIK